MARKQKTWQIKGRIRRGATMVETAFVLVMFLMLIFGMIDLGIMVTRAQALSEAARNGARQAIVRGELANSPLGPSALSIVASDANPIADAIRPQLLLMDPTQVHIDVTWPENSNAINRRVHVRVSADFTPIMTFIFGAPTWKLTGDSEMYIAH